MQESFAGLQLERLIGRLPQFVAVWEVKPRWPTKETIKDWERNRAKASNFRIVSSDSSVATMVLDGEAWGRVPWDSLPSLAAAIQLVPMADHIARVRESKVAYKWMQNFSLQPAHTLLLLCRCVLAMLSCKIS